MKKTFKDYLKYKYKKTRLEYWTLVIFIFVIAYLLLSPRNSILNAVHIIVLPGLLNLFIISYHFFHDDSDSKGDKENSSEDE